MQLFPENLATISFSLKTKYQNLQCKTSKDEIVLTITEKCECRD